jgi:hypothetical protein
MFLSTIRLSLLAIFIVLTSCLSAGGQTSVDALPSWYDGTAKQAILSRTPSGPAVYSGCINRPDT